MNIVSLINTANNVQSFNAEEAVSAEGASLLPDFFVMLDLGAGENKVDLPINDAIDFVELDPQLVSMIQMQTPLPILNEIPVQDNLDTLSQKAEELGLLQGEKENIFPSLNYIQQEKFVEIVNQKSEELAEGLKIVVQENIAPLVNDLIQKTNDKIDEIKVKPIPDVMPIGNLDEELIEETLDRDLDIEISSENKDFGFTEKTEDTSVRSHIIAPRQPEKDKWEVGGEEKNLDDLIDNVKDDIEKSKRRYLNESSEEVDTDGSDAAILYEPVENDTGVKLKFNQLVSDVQEIKKTPVNDNVEVKQVAKTVPQEKTPTVTEQIRFVVEQSSIKGDSKISLTLHPEELGKLEINFDNTDGNSKITFVAEKSDTLDLLQAEILSLEKALNYSGIKTEDTQFNFDLMPKFQNGNQDGQMSGNGKRLHDGDTQENQAQNNIREFTANYYRVEDGKVDIRI